MKNFIFALVIFPLLLLFNLNVWANEQKNMHCPVGCQIDKAQMECQPSKAHVEEVPGGMVQYRGIATVPALNEKSPVLCGTLDEKLNCLSGHGIAMMDVELPRFYFSLARLSPNRLQLDANYSWNGKRPGGKMPEFFSTYTAIITAIEVKLRKPGETTPYFEKRIDLHDSGLNYGGYMEKKCNASSGENLRSDSFYRYQFDLDVPVQITDGTKIEVRAIGNYE